MKNVDTVNEFYLNQLTDGELKNNTPFDTSPLNQGIYSLWLVASRERNPVKVAITVLTILS